jgi:DNA-binding PucR family transcriptional regulator
LEIIMRTTVIIKKRGEGYTSTVSGKHGGGHQGARCGLTAYDAAATAARYMIEYAQSNDEGGDLMAPAEVLELVPQHLRNIPAKELP